MPAVPIYVWNGSAWQETGPTIPASPIKYQASAPSSPSTGDIWVDSDGDVTTGSQQFQRFRFVASGGETTISGADANGAVLAYTAGLEQVVLNGAVLVRGHDYTATNGTSITGLSPALVASDVLEVFSFIAFTVANTYTQAQVDGLLDSYVGLRLITPTSVVNGTVGTTGAVTFTSQSSVSLNGVFSSKYQNYRIVINTLGAGAGGGGFGNRIRLRASGTDNSASNYRYAGYGLGDASASAIFKVQSNGTTTSFLLEAASSQAYSYKVIDVFMPFDTQNTSIQYQGMYLENTPQFFGYDMGGIMSVTTSYDGFTFFTSDAGTSLTGTIRVYGYKD